MAEVVSGALTLATSAGLTRRNASMPDHLRVAIDGPAGSGKSTIGERVARALGYLYIDTGAMYRALTLVMLERRLDPADGDALGELAERMDLRVVLPTVTDGRQYTVLVDGRDVTPELRTPEVEAAVSAASRHSRVRAAMRDRQRALAAQQGVVMVGRDIGTVVLPDADLKIFLQVSLDERTRRRHRDLVAALGDGAPSFEWVRADLARRDSLDAAQMQRAPDARVIVTDELQADDVVSRIVAMAHERTQQ
jgi:CMP/dCMP kinase